MNQSFTFKVADIPLWKERCIYALLYLLGYKTAEWMLLEQVKDGDNEQK